MEVSVSALEHNIKEIQKRVDGVPLMGVVKADGYGHGAVETARVLKRCGVSRFAVATIEEGLSLRGGGITDPITVLSPCPSSCALLLSENDMLPLLGSLKEAQSFSKALKGTGKTLDAFVSIDTGMCRVGIDACSPDAADEIASICSLSEISVHGLFSHFSSADESDLSFTELQHRRFMDCAGKVMEKGIDLQTLCIANSGAIISYPPSWHDMVRPGIILYGCQPSDQVDDTVLDLRPAMQIKAKIMRIREVDDDTPVSYGRTYHACGPRKIATIPVGYDDGYCRILSSKARVIVRGQYAPQIGNICMDQCMIDVTDIKGVEEGDTVTLMGRDGSAFVSAEELADICGTINYEILCGFGHRLPVIYVSDED